MHYSGKAQELKDTIYLDEDWAICEKPVAEYFRVATLKTDNVLMYVGDVTDYYIDGQVEMTGFYDENGLRNGHFIFYHNNGKKREEGDFVRDKLVGLWSYYNIGGDLRVQLNCNSAFDFTPLFIVTPGGDTILKNGNGRFIFNTVKHLPQVFRAGVNYTVEGEVINGKKHGEFKYWINEKAGKENSLCTDTFKDGVFKKSKSNNFQSSQSTPCNQLNLFNGKKLFYTDLFYHANHLFGLGKTSEQKLISFLVDREIPEIPSKARSFEENVIDFYQIIDVVLSAELHKKNKPLFNSYHRPNTNAPFEFFNYQAPFNSAEVPRQIESEMTVTIDTFGFVSKSAFKGNLTKREVDRINYYLSRLTNLATSVEQGQARDADIKIRMITLASRPGRFASDTMIDYSYLAFVSGTEVFHPGDEKPAIFAGGQKAWIRYLERNLDATAPIRDNAPVGNYTVFVQFTVDEEGNIGEVIAVEPAPGCRSCTVEAERVIREGPKWVPAIRNGVNVRYKGKQGITFQRIGG